MAVTNHSRYRELAAVSVDAVLTTDEHAELWHHLASCAECRSVEHGLRQDAAALAVPFEAEPSAGVQAEIERRLLVPPIDPHLLRMIRIAVGALTVIVLVMALVLAGALIDRPAPDVQETREPEPAGALNFPAV